MEARIQNISQCRKNYTFEVKGLFRPLYMKQYCSPSNKLQEFWRKADMAVL